MPLGCASARRGNPNPLQLIKNVLLDIIIKGVSLLIVPVGVARGGLVVEASPLRVVRVVDVVSPYRRSG